MDLKHLSEDNSIEEEADRLGGGSFLVDTGIYDFTVKAAYVKLSDKKATSLNIHLATQVEKVEKIVRATFWMTSNETKGCKNYYEKTVEGKKVRYYLPGFNAANSLCLLTADKPIAQMQTTEKTINLYDFKQGGEVPEKVNMIMDMIGKKVTAAVFKQLVNKRALNDATGQYEAIADTREENEVDKFFKFDGPKKGYTVHEAKKGFEKPIFLEKWKAKNEGITKDLTDKTVTQTANGTKAVLTQTGENAPSLFEGGKEEAPEGETETPEIPENTGSGLFS